MASDAANAAIPSGPVPFKDVDDGTVPEHTPKEEFGDLVAALPRRQQWRPRSITEPAMLIIASSGPCLLCSSLKFFYRSWCRCASCVCSLIALVWWLLVKLVPILGLFGKLVKQQLAVT